MLPHHLCPGLRSSFSWVYRYSCASSPKRCYYWWRLGLRPGILEQPIRSKNCNSRSPKGVSAVAKCSSYHVHYLRLVFLVYGVGGSNESRPISSLRAGQSYACSDRFSLWNQVRPFCEGNSGVSAEL